MMKNKVYQTGTIGSLLNAVYEGDKSFMDLTRCWDFGLGTLNGVDGEMIGFDGKFYQINDKGIVREISSKEITPFSVVTHFEPNIFFEVENLSSLLELEAYIDKKLESLNYIYMMRLTGHFSYIKMRSMACQTKPYQPLVAVLEKAQKIFEIHNTTGTLVVTRFPEYLSQINVSGYHLHYLDDQKQQGGHVFDLKVSKAKVAIMKHSKLEIDLIDNELFAKAALHEDISSATQKVEKKRGD